MILITLLQFTTVLTALSEGMAPKNESKDSEFLDYRKLGLVGEVRNQGSCNAGWAFAIIGK